MTEESSTKQPRVRMNVSVTSKGAPSWDLTVDGQESDWTGDQIFAETNRLVALLAERYQPINRGADVS